MNKFIAIILSLIIFIMHIPCFAQETISETSDKAIEETVSQKTLPYDYSSTYYVPIKLAIVTPITTKGEKIYEGQTIQFKVKETAYSFEKPILFKGTLVNAKIETIISSGMNGFPAEIIIGNFEIPNIKSSQLQDTYIKKGQNRCYIVYPIKWALTIIPFVGTLTNFIMGGHAKIKTKDEIVIYYYPEWK